MNLIRQIKIQQRNKKAAVYVPNGKLAIPTFDHENVIVCHAVKSSKILAPGKNEPKYILLELIRSHSGANIQQYLDGMKH